MTSSNGELQKLFNFHKQRAQFIITHNKQISMLSGMATLSVIPNKTKERKFSESYFLAFSLQWLCRKLELNSSGTGNSALGNASSRKMAISVISGRNLELKVPLDASLARDDGVSRVSFQS